jgi:hypothetical protein
MSAMEKVLSTKVSPPVFDVYALEDAVRQHVATKFSRLSDQIKGLHSSIIPELIYF